MTTAGIPADAASAAEPPDAHAGEVDSPARQQFSHVPGPDRATATASSVPTGVDLYENNAWFADATVSFMILKAWEYREDTRFAARFPLVKSQGRLRGAYLFGHPSLDAGKQAASFVTVLRDCGFGPGDTAWLDHEVSDGKSPSWCSSWAQDVCGHVDAGLGLASGATGVYTFRDFIWQGNCSGLGQRALWLAVPSVLGQPPAANLGPWASPVLVQYQVTSIDWDYFNGDAAGLRTFWGASAPAPPPATNWTETIVNELPLVGTGGVTSGEDVKTVQGLLNARGAHLAIDGAFGPVTTSAVTGFQTSSGLSADGKVGPVTWAKLLRR